MSRSLIIVESPTKSKTLRKYLSNDFQIAASYGHVRDLVPKTGAVDPHNNFVMRYQTIEKNEKHTAQLLKQWASASTIWLATDPDREGEAIAWHICQLAQEAGLLSDKIIHRVRFYEFTERAIKEAMQSPQTLSMPLVNAQQARRALDYLVGFELSPLLWKKIRRGLSAGRVQSPALRLIAEREQEIKQFTPKEYWSIEAQTEAQGQALTAKLAQYGTEKIEQFSITTAQAAQDMRQKILQTKQPLSVEKIEKKQRKRQPAPPFITSTLQQEASRKLSFAVQKTMRVAQQLYEGVETAEGMVGLITYMRTDSIHLAPEAIVEIRAWIEAAGQPCPEKPRVFKSKSKNAQEAHEAIRPSAIHRTPESLQPYLQPDQMKLYQLIWQRTVASQMADAILDLTLIWLASGEALFKLNGSIVRTPGFLALYEESSDEKNEDAKRLPALKEGDSLPLQQLDSIQHFTEPPPRYSEASLIKALEERGIGRPSTYASILSTLISREYAQLTQKRFYATDVGQIVSRFLTEHFSHYVDYDFTAKLEDELDDVSRGEQEWQPLLAQFWKPFEERLKTVAQTVSRQEITQEALEEHCPQCQKILAIRLGKRGRFIGCTGYPECNFTRDLNPSTASDAQENSTESEAIPAKKCPLSGHDLVLRSSRYGKFWGCSHYPKCKYIEASLKKQAATSTQVVCPACQKGEIQVRKSARGEFYACSAYPECQYLLNHPPIPDTRCPQCQWPIMVLKETKRWGKQKICPQKACGFAETFTEATENTP